MTVDPAATTTTAAAATDPTVARDVIRTEETVRALPSRMGGAE